MKHLKTSLLLIGISLSFNGLLAQCPGTTVVVGPGTGVPYTITTTDLSCGINAEIDVTVPGVLPNISYFWSINGGAYSEVAAADVDFMPAEPGNYSFVIYDSSILTVDVCNFTVENNYPCPGDFNGDGLVNSTDLLELLGTFPSPVCEDCCTDMNFDGAINTSDFLLFMNVFNQPCGMAPIATDTVLENETNEAIKQLMNGEMQNEVNIEIYPNPSQGNVNIEIENLTSDFSTSAISIIDITGRQVENLNWNIVNNTARLNMTDLASGTYIITIATDSKKYAQSFIVQ